MSTTPDKNVNVEAAAWLIEGWLPARAFAFIYGQPVAGKSFLAPDALDGNEVLKESAR